MNTGTRVPGFKNKVMVDIEQMMSYAHGLRTSAPAEVMEAQEVIRQKESIINQANLEARRIKATASQEAAAVKQAAQVEYLSKVDEAEILKAAENKVEEMHDEAQQEAQRVTHRAQEKPTAWRTNWKNRLQRSARAPTSMHRKCCRNWRRNSPTRWVRFAEGWTGSARRWPTGEPPRRPSPQVTSRHSGL